MGLKNFISVIWQFPQMAIGTIVAALFGTGIFTKYKDATIYSWKFNSGLSLGRYIFVPFDENTCHKYQALKYIKHEYGHTIQSKYLGWLYLLIIGVPSAVWKGCFSWYRKKTGKSYYWFYTEKSADSLGGVVR